jgi:hypothetical protein
MPSRNLVPGQYQIGQLIFGAGTTIRCEQFDIKPYDVVGQDYQISRTDEKRYGMDHISPTTIDIKLSVLNNKILDQFNPPQGLTRETFWQYFPTQENIAYEWKADEVRRQWGALKPIYICGVDGVTRVIYGRPGAFTAAKASPYAEWLDCIGEYRRADTLVYREKESAVDIPIGGDPLWIRRNGKQDGDSDAWFRLLLQGPIDHPIITVGVYSIELDFTIDADDYVEISSYPWARRVINSERRNLSTRMIGNTEYLDVLRIPSNTDVPVRWTDQYYGTFVPDLGNAIWMEDIADIHRFNIPETFRTHMGKAVVRWGMYADEHIGFPLTLQMIPKLGKYLGAAIWENTTAISYIADHYKTTTQYAEVKLAGIFNGKSAMCINCDSEFQNFAALSVECLAAGIGSKLTIRSSNSGPTGTAIQASWTNPLTEGFDFADKVGFAYDPTTKTYTGYLNDEEVISWPDPTGIVTVDAATKNTQGYIFDLDGNLLTFGLGFRDLINYDRVYVPASTGKMQLLWRDAWSTIP